MHLSRIFLYTLELFQRPLFPYRPGAIERLSGRNACQEEQNFQTWHAMMADLERKRHQAWHISLQTWHGKRNRSEKCWTLNTQHVLDQVQRINGRGLAHFWTRSNYAPWTRSSNPAIEGLVRHMSWTWSSRYQLYASGEFFYTEAFGRQHFTSPREGKRERGGVTLIYR